LQGAHQRVLVIGSRNLPDAMEWHVVDALHILGHEVAVMDTRVAGANWGRLSAALASKAIDIFLREPERRAEPRLLRKVEQFAPTLILVILGSQLSPKTVVRLRKATKAPIVCWCQDQMTTLGRQYLLGAGYDAVFLKDRYMQDLFSRMIKSTSFYYLAEACNPRVHRRIELTPDDLSRFGCDVGIACTLYYYRQEILQQLGEFDLKLWGTVPDWLLYRLRERPRGREIFMDDKARAACGARISLNTLHFAEIDGLNSRAFELAGCGAFQMVTSRPVLQEHFLPGIEVETFESIGELIEKIRHYLQHPESAASIAERGQKRAYAEHTYEHRLQEIFRIAMK
jgi:spore maturation protein CgeB